MGWPDSFSGLRVATTINGAQKSAPWGRITSSLGICSSSSGRMDNELAHGMQLATLLAVEQGGVKCVKPGARCNAL